MTFGEANFSTCCDEEGDERPTGPTWRRTFFPLPNSAGRAVNGRDHLSQLKFSIINPKNREQRAGHGSFFVF